MIDLNDDAPSARAPTIGPGSVPAPRWVHDKSYPLASVIQLTTLAAATLACLDANQLLDELNRMVDHFPGAAMAAIAGCVCIVGLLGVLVGVGQRRRWRSAVVGSVVGALCGLLMLAVYAAPAPLFQGLGAAAMLLLTSIALRAGAA
jgi:hypothetical protein